MSRDKGKPKITKIAGEEETTYVQDYAVHANEPIGLSLVLTYVVDESGTVKRR